jgi:fatty acid desaturase
MNAEASSEPATRPYSESARATEPRVARAHASPATELRRHIKRDLSPATFAARPMRALWFLPLVGVAVAGTALLGGGHGIDVLTTILAIVLVGNVYASGLLLAHEIMHGAVVRGRRVQYLLSWLGFLPFLISPTLWRVWHNEVHHGNTNRIDCDPDIFAGEAMHANTGASRFILWFVPGAGGVASLAFPFVWFCAHGQIVLWFLSLRMPGFERLNRRRAKLEVAAMLAFWVGVGALVGPRWVLAILAPMAAGNCVLMSYIATNHLLRPLVESSDPLRCSMSVRTLGILDRLHFRFSHHVEHHLFPAMSGANLPRVRAWLRVNVAESFVCPSHVTALMWLWTTPRTYRDATTLVDPRRPERAPVDLDLLARTMQPMKRDM